MARPPRHPLLESAVALLALASGLLLVALPRPGGSGARADDLADHLDLVRSVILDYGQDHRTENGRIFPGADGDARTFASQLTKPTKLRQTDWKSRGIGSTGGRSHQREAKRG